MLLPLMLGLALSATAAPEPQAPADEKPRLFVLSLSAQGVTPAQAEAFTDALVNVVSARGLFDVISTRDVQTLLGAERQKQLLGMCDSDPAACSSDLSASLQARFILSGQLSRVGSAFQLTLQTVDTKSSAPLGRSTRFAGTFEALRALVPFAAAEATGSPLPPPPSRVVPITLISVGGATAFAGGVVGLFTVSRQQQLNDELCPGGVPADGRCTGVALRDRSFYVAQDEALRRQLLVAGGLLVAGVVAAGVGVWLMPPTQSEGSASLLLVPQADGFALAGSF